jgi:REG-2-like HAD superfamily hydrolase
MSVKAVTFDCAETLVQVFWSPGRFAVECAGRIGLDVGDDRAAAEYERLLQERWPQFLEANLTRDPDRGDEFWRSLTSTWLTRLRRSDEGVERVFEVAQEILFAPDSRMFVLFDDVLPVMETLEGQGLRLAVISNWDYSLHRVLRSKGIYDRFEQVVASLEEGVEKPDPRLFQLTLDRLGVAPDEVLHVGDNPVDDFEGAKAAGMHAAWLDRGRRSRVGHIIPSLKDLPEVLASIR